MPNRLAQETSPYLLQHADNPVDWYAWGEDAFAEAKRLDEGHKPLAIGPPVGRDLVADAQFWRRELKHLDEVEIGRAHV